MRQTKRIGELQISQDIAFQRQSWRIQRIGWIVMGVLILAGVLGLLGPGLLSQTIIATPDRSLRVEYDQRIRLHAPARLQIQAIPNSASEGQGEKRILQLQISREYLQQFQIAYILPEPEEVLNQPDHLLYHFFASASDQPVSVTIDLEAEQMGWVEGEIALDADSKVQLKQWIFP